MNTPWAVTLTDFDTNVCKFEKQHTVTAISHASELFGIDSTTQQQLSVTWRELHNNAKVTRRKTH